MAAIQGLFGVQNTNVAQAGGTVNGSGEDARPTTFAACASIPASSFVASREYLIIASALIECAGAAAEHHIRLVHGTTPTEFTDSDAVMDPTAANGGNVLGWMHRFTQPSTTEEVRLEAGGETTNVLTVLGSQIIALALNDLTENTDYFWNEVTTDYLTTTTMTAQAAVTFTPNGTDDWLIIGQFVQGLPVVQTTPFNAQIHDSVSGSTEPAVVMEGEDPDAGDERRSILMARVFTPSAASHTFSVRFSHGGASTFNVYSSRIFALNLNKFNQHFTAFTSGATTPATSPTWTTVASGSINPSVTGDWCIIGSYVFDPGATTAEQNIRMQHDNSGSLVSEPAYGDDGVNAGAWDATDDLSHHLLLLRSLTSGATRTVNLDATNVAGTGTAKQRSMVGFSLELASAGPPPEKIPQFNSQYGSRW